MSRHSGAGRLPAVRFLHVASQLNAGDLAKETAKLLALELFRQDKVSMGRAAELCYTPIEAFIEFAAEHEVPLHYGIAELEEDRHTLANCCRDSCFRFIATHHSGPDRLARSSQ